MALELDKMTRLPGDEAFRRESIKGTQWESTYAGALSFMRRKYTRDLTGVDIAVTGIPFDQAVSHRPGTRFGPEGMRKASAESLGPFGQGCSIPSIPGRYRLRRCSSRLGRKKTSPMRWTPRNRNHQRRANGLAWRKSLQTYPC